MAACEPAPASYAVRADSVYEQAGRLIERSDYARADSLLAAYFSEQMTRALEIDSARAAQMRIRHGHVLYQQGRYREALVIYEDARRYWYALRDTARLITLNKALSTLYLWQDTTRVDSLALAALDEAERLARLTESKADGSISSELENIALQKAALYRWRAEHSQEGALPALRSRADTARARPEGARLALETWAVAGWMTLFLFMLLCRAVSDIHKEPALSR